MSTILPENGPSRPETPEASGAPGSNEPETSAAGSPGEAGWPGSTPLTSSGWAGAAPTRPSGEPAPPPAPGVLSGRATPASPTRRRVRRRRAAAAGVLLAAAVAGFGIGGVLQQKGATATGSTSAATLSLPHLDAKVDPALVDVVSTLDYGAAEAAGTGILLTASGEIVTNNHVVDGATSIRVTDIGNGRTYSATVVGYDVTSDVAVIKLNDASGLSTAPLGNSNGVAVGQGVVAIGNAGGVGGTPSAATGTVTALGQDITASDESTGSQEQLTNMIETDADVQAGDSGGPLVNMSGQVVGIDTAGSSTFQFQSGQFQSGQFQSGQFQSGQFQSGQFQSGGSQNGNVSDSDGFAIPINEAVSIANQIESGKSSSSVHIGATAFLGVDVASTSASSGSQFGASGAGVVGVVSGSPAASAGLSEGDTITSVAHKTISSSTSLRDVLDEFHPGQKVSITWTDPTGASHTATVDLASGPTG